MIGVAERRYLLPSDVETVAVSAEEVSIGRPGSRTPAQLVSTEAADLLAQFRTPARLADAVIAHCAATGGDPVATLDEAFGVLIALTRSGVLVPDGSDEAEMLAARRQAGDRVGPAVLHTPIRLVRDTEIWRGRLDDGRPVIVKTIDQPGLGPDLFTREAAALERLDGGLAPPLLWQQVEAGGGTMIMAEVAGDPVDLVAECGEERDRRPIAVAVVAAYAELHRVGVRHGDVHPGNILLDADRRVRLIDFGLAAVPGLPPAPRPAGGECLDPQSAAALLAERPLPALDAAAEQYALAALAFRLVTGQGYLDLERERTDALRSIVHTPPRRFAAVAGPWAAGERVLRRALAKDPADRFPSVPAFAEALRRAWRGLAPMPVQYPDLSGVLAQLEVTGTIWAEADATEAGHAAWLLTRVAALTGDVTAHDLAEIWSCRAGQARLDPPEADQPIVIAHRALAAYRRTGASRQLLRARQLAEQLRSEPAGRLGVHRGPWAGWLLDLECRSPADAAPPGWSAT